MASLYSLCRLFTGDPTDLPSLRMNTLAKLDAGKPKGVFVFTMEAEENSPKAPSGLGEPRNQPAMVVSWGGEDATEKKYWQSVVKAKKFIKGSYTCETKRVDAQYVSEGRVKVRKVEKRFYEFTVEKGSEKQLAEYLQLPGFSVGFWNVLGAERTAMVKVNGNALAQRSLTDNKWTIVEYDVIRMLTVKGFFDAPPLTGKESSLGFTLPGGLTLPPQLSLSWTIFGQVVESAEMDALTAARLRDPLPGLMRPWVTQLAKQLDKADKAFAEAAGDKKKELAALQKANDALDSFDTEAKKAMNDEVEKQWLTVVQAFVDYYDFQVESAVTIIKGTITSAAGLTAVGLGGVSGVLAVLGLVGTLKGAMETINAVYDIFRHVHDLGAEIEESLGALVRVKGHAAGWKDLGHSSVASLPGGTVLQSALAQAGLSTKSSAQIEDDIKTYNAKISGLLQKATDLSKKLMAAGKAHDEAQAALVAPKNEKDEDRKAREEKRALVEKAYAPLLDKKFLDGIAKLNGDFDTGKKKVASYEALLEGINEELAKNKAGDFLKKYALPVTDLVYSVDPSNLRATLQGAGTITLTLSQTLMGDLKVMGERGDIVSGWLSFANDNSNTIAGILESLEPLESV